MIDGQTLYVFEKNVKSILEKNNPRNIPWEFESLIENFNTFCYLYEENKKLN